MLARSSTQSVRPAAAGLTDDAECAARAHRCRPSTAQRAATRACRACRHRAARRAGPPAVRKRQCGARFGARKPSVFECAASGSAPAACRRARHAYRIGADACSASGAHDQYAHSSKRRRRASPRRALRIKAHDFDASAAQQLLLVVAVRHASKRAQVRNKPLHNDASANLIDHWLALCLSSTVCRTHHTSCPRKKSFQ